MRIFPEVVKRLYRRRIPYDAKRMEGQTEGRGIRACGARCGDRVVSGCGLAIQLMGALAQLVESVDEPGRTRVQVSVDFPVVPVQYTYLAPLQLYHVPANHRLVIEQVARQCTTNKGITNATLFTYVDGKEGRFPYTLSTEAGNAGQADSQFFSQRVTAYSDPNTTVLLTFRDHRSQNNSWQCSATLAGHLVELQGAGGQ